MVETKEQLEKMPEVVTDESGEDVAKQMAEMLQKDIDAYEKRIPQLKKELENYTEQLAIDEKLWEILENKDTYKKKETHWLFEDVEGYWELQYQKNMYKLRQAKAQAYGQKEQIV